MRIEFRRGGHGSSRRGGGIWQSQKEHAVDGCRNCDKQHNAEDHGDHKRRDDD
jgi:hypothetical protein